MSKLRLKFSKLGMGKYISHLDLLRTFTRAISRANLPVKYSQGFNPHQLISFALPLPIGATSESEFVDINFETEIEPNAVMEKLNLNLPPDIKILSAAAPVHKSNDISAIDYVITINSQNEITSEKTDSFFAQNEILIVKKTKKGEKEVNLKDYIYRYEIIKAEKNEIKVSVIFLMNESGSVKPEKLISAFEDYMGFGEFDNTEIHRRNLFCTDSEKNEEKFEIFY